MPVSQTDKFEAEQRWIGPLLFWLCLVLATGLFGAVLLAPKILNWAKLRHEYHTNQIELVTIEQQVKYLNRVTEAFEKDPRFSEEVARIDFHALEPGTERFPVEDSLNPLMQIHLPDKQPQPAELPWYVPLLKSFIQQPEIRNLCLAISVVLTLVAFALLPQPEEPMQAETEGRESGWMKKRYRRKAK